MLRFAANISTLFREWRFLDRFQAAHEAGFEAVEMQFPYDEKPGDLARVMEKAGVTVVLINVPVVEGHRFGLAGLAPMRGEFRKALARAAEYADALGARHVNVLAGCPPLHTERAASLAALVENLLEAHERLEPQGTGVLLEAINTHDVPGYLVGDFATASSIVARCEGRVGLQFDIYHARRMGLDPASALRPLLSAVRHVQFADAPGRQEPGSGDIDFDAAWKLLQDQKYRGWIGAEYTPRAGTRPGLDWLREWREKYDV